MTDLNRLDYCPASINFMAVVGRYVLVTTVQMVNMKPLLLLFSLLLSGCVTAPIESFYDGTSFVAESHSEELKNAKTPQGFLISPAEAFSLLKLDPIQKNSWSIYADFKNYFFVENFPLRMTTSADARMYGRRVNGRTGKTDANMEY